MDHCLDGTEVEDFDADLDVQSGIVRTAPEQIQAPPSMEALITADNNGNCFEDVAILVFLSVDFMIFCLCWAFIYRCCLLGG